MGKDIKKQSYLIDSIFDGYQFHPGFLNPFIFVVIV